MSVTIMIEGPCDEVDSAVTIVAGVMDLARPERTEWGYPQAGVRVTVEATVTPLCP